jgi:UDP-glucose 4-epimerase
VPKVVFLSSHYVYGARRENSQFLTEESPLLGAQDTPGLRDLVEADMLASSFFWKCSEIATVILRPVHVLGRVRNAISNLLRMKRIPKLVGFDPMMQIIHEKDVVEALTASLQPEARGIFNVAGPGEIPYSVILEELGKPTLPVPHFCPSMLLKILWMTHTSPIEGPEMDHLRYISMVDDTRIRNELHFSPKFSIKETIRSVLEDPTDPHPVPVKGSLNV